MGLPTPRAVWKPDSIVSDSSEGFTVDHSMFKAAKESRMKSLKHFWFKKVFFIACLVLLCNSGLADDTCVLTDIDDDAFFTFTAPVVPATRTTSSNRVYLAFFKPGGGNFWEGNVIRLGISANDEIVDLNGNPAFSDTSESSWAWALKEDAVPFWETRNWADASKSNYVRNSNRNIYTYLGTSKDLTAAANSFTKDNLGLTPAVLGRPIQTPEVLIGYIRGTDVFDADGDGNIEENRDVITGDVLHSEPLVVDYNGSLSVVYFGANDGMLHAVKDSPSTTPESDDGTEMWAFIPPDQLPRLKYLVEGDAHPYFVDSSPKVYLKDVNRNGLIEPEEGDRVILVCGERKGGTSYFALDVTDPDRPEFLWRINPYDDAETGALELEDIRGTFENGEVLTGSSGGSATVESAPVGNLLRYALRTGSFTVGERVSGKASSATGTIVSDINYAPDVIIPELGETWSEPQFGIVKTSDEDEDGAPVFFIGGGYTSDNSSGKAILVVRVYDGAVLKKFSGISGMNYSIPSSVTAVDGDSNGFVDKFYVGDLGGQMWRFGKFTDFEGNQLEFPNTDENILNWTDQAARIIFLSDLAHGRKFFYPPSVTLEAGYDLVFMGTGDREDVCNPISSDRIYAVKDSHDSRTFTEEDLIDVTENVGTTPDFSVHQGWYIRLAEGEKVSSEGVVFLKTFYVTTYQPAEGGTLYALNYKTGESVSRFLNRKVWQGGGILSKPVIVIHDKSQKLLTSRGAGQPGSESPSVGPGILVVEPAAPPSNFFYLWWKEL